MVLNEGLGHLIARRSQNILILESAEIMVPLVRSRRILKVPCASGEQTTLKYGSCLLRQKVTISTKQVPQYWKEGHPPLTCTMNVVRDIEREVVVDHMLDLIDIIITFSVFMASVVEP
jgi:hypothetical protein